MHILRLMDVTGVLFCFRLALSTGGGNDCGDEGVSEGQLGALVGNDYIFICLEKIHELVE